MGEPKPRTVRSPKRWVGFWWRAGVAYSRVGLAASWKQLAAERTTLPIGVMLLDDRARPPIAKASTARAAVELALEGLRAVG